jgi:competence ComEA-like helix-hairpin-helix protein
MTESKQQRIQLFAFIISILICVFFSLAFTASSVIHLSPARNGCGIVLDDKINPNNATAASLARLPNIGHSRAQAVIEYKESFAAKNGDIPVFRDCNDLQRVKGIGPRTVQNLNQWLRFE